MKSFRKAMMWVVMLTALVANVPSGALARPQVKTDPQVVAKMTQILERSGYTYKKAKDNIWVVTFKGKSLAEINVLVTTVENLIVMGVVIAEKDAMKNSPEMMFKLLHLAHDIDRVKIGFDDDNDLFLRAEVTTRCFELADFKAFMEQISLGADKVHAAIKPYLTQ
jgi:hypothetical protein